MPGAHGGVAQVALENLQLDPWRGWWAFYAYADYLLAPVNCGACADYVLRPIHDYRKNARRILEIECSM